MVPWFSLLLTTLSVLRYFDQVFCRQTVPQFGFVWCLPHGHTGVMNFWEEGHRDQRVHITDMMYCWCWPYLGLRYCLSSFPIVKVLFLPTLPVVFFGRKSLVQPTLKKWGVILLPWGQSIYINCLEFLCMGNCSLHLPCLFSQSFLLVWTCGCLCLGYHLIFLYFTAQIAPILAFGNSFISFCVSLTRSHLFVFWTLLTGITRFSFPGSFYIVPVSCPVNIHFSKDL